MTGGNELAEIRGQLPTLKATVRGAAAGHWTSTASMGT